MERLISEMRRQPRAVALVGVMLLLCAGWWFKSRQSPSSANAASPVSAESAAAPAIAARPPVKIRYTPVLRRDPFNSKVVFPPREPVKPVEKSADVHPVVPEPDPQQLALETARMRIRLSAIFMSQNPVAVINGVAYQTGDTVEGFQITRISPRSVVLERGSARVLVSVK